MVAQSRNRSFQKDDHLLTVLRYVERNPVRAGLVESARLWPYSSAYAEASIAAMLDRGPVLPPADWLERVDTPQTEAEVKVLRACVPRRRPYGGSGWMAATAERLGLTARLRPIGRPRKRPLVQPTLFGDEQNP